MATNFSVSTMGIGNVSIVGQRALDDCHPFGFVVSPTKGSPLLYNDSKVELKHLWKRFKDTVVDTGKLSAQFRCSCAKSCFERQLKLTTNRLNTPAKIDLTDNNFNKKSYPVNNNAPEPYFSSSAIRILIAKREQEQKTMVSYTSTMLVADLANALGLFFGFSMIALYETLERAHSNSTELQSDSKEKKPVCHSSRDHTLSREMLPKECIESWKSGLKRLEQLLLWNVSRIFRLGAQHQGSKDDDIQKPLNLWERCWPGVWVACLIAVQQQCAGQGLYYSNEPVYTAVDVKGQASFQPWLWFSYEGLLKVQGLPMEAVTSCTNLAGNSCLPGPSCNQSCGWHYTAEPHGLMCSFLPFPPTKVLIAESFWWSIDQEVFRDQKWLVLGGTKNQGDVQSSKGNSALTSSMKVELTLPPAGNEWQSANMVFFAVHMPPQLPMDSAQPFAFSDDSSALLESGKVYEFQAKLTRYRRIGGKKLRCTNALSLSSLQVAKNAWAYVILQARNVPVENRCRTQWLDVIPMTNSPDNLQLQKDFTTRLPVCDEFSLNKAYFTPETIYRQTILETNYSDTLIGYLPDRALPLLPCVWDTVTFDQAQPQLYKIKKCVGCQGNKLRLVLTTRQDVEEFVDYLGYPTLSFISNIFGIVGLYLGYSLLDVYTLGERLYHISQAAFWKLFAFNQHFPCARH